MSKTIFVVRRLSLSIDDVQKDESIGAFESMTDAAKFLADKAVSSARRKAYLAELARFQNDKNSLGESEAADALVRFHMEEFMPEEHHDFIKNTRDFCSRDNYSIEEVTLLAPGEDAS